MSNQPHETQYPLGGMINIEGGVYQISTVLLKDLVTYDCPTCDLYRLRDVGNNRQMCRSMVCLTEPGRVFRKVSDQPSDPGPAPESLL